ncbi:myocardial zonula adherens protein isoform X2 [Denticeps clupeoides]|uniref:myocardial zonula adherens protein isoform X2 n=1 Tax=Denticeps clupeoides TaxID=299321 RepID=UPI0010A482FD|nr:myocardial zonula adherens protein-like isoform X2 [Denticeps clupeoides]
MLRGGTAGSVTTLSDTGDQSERAIRRLRLTLHDETVTNGQKDSRQTATNAERKAASDTWPRRNGLIHRERPAGRESPVEVEEHRVTLANGVREHPTQNGPKYYGVVQRTGSNQHHEVMAREWSANHLEEEMKYIREVRDSLEKVRERMYGQFGGMQQTVEKLSREIKAANSHRRSLEAEVRVRTAALDSFDQMNSSLITANIDLQKSLLERCQERVGSRDEMKTLRKSYRDAERKLKETERELATAQAENRALSLKVESSHEASAQALKELSTKLQKEYEVRLQEEQRKHREEIEALQAQIDNYIKRIEQLEKNAKIAEAKIAEKDQRISEVERLLDCMGREKNHLMLKLQDCEQKLQQLDVTDHCSPAAARRSEEVKEEASELRERIKHLNDMVFCQQRKVKGMIEEVETLRSKVAQKDMFISELLDRIAIVECEKEAEKRVNTREIGVGCDLLVHRPEPERPQQQPQPQPPVLTQPRIASMPPSRLDYSLLKFTPVQYSQMLQSHPLISGRAEPTESPTERSTEVQTSPVSPTLAQSPPNPYGPRTRTGVYTPFMKLMEISANINIE